MGIRQEIQNAKTTEEVQTLLSKSKTYKNASEKTKRHWNKTAENRIIELNKVKA